MLIKTFKFIYKDEVIFSCDTQVIDGFELDYEEPIFSEPRFSLPWIIIKHRYDYYMRRDASNKNGNNPNSNFFISDPSITEKEFDSRCCKFYINGGLIESNFEDKKLINLTLKNIADKYTNVIYCNNQLFVFGTSPSKQMLDKHLNICEVYKENIPNEVIELKASEDIERLLKKRHLSIKNITIKITGLCNYGVVFGIRTFEPFFYFILKYKFMYVFDENTNSYYKIWIDDDINISKLNFIEKGEIYF